MYKRIIISVILSILIIIVSLGIASYLTVSDTIEGSLKRRLELAKMMARHTDLILENNFNRLYDISLSGSVDLRDGDWTAERKALQAAYQYSLFTDGIFLLDKTGSVLLAYPAVPAGAANLLSVPSVSRSLREGKPAVSDIFTVEPTRRKVIFALVPLKNKRGEVVGVAGGEINPTNYMLGQIIETIPTEQNTFLELVDSNGTVIASNNPDRIFTGSDHNNFLRGLIHSRASAVRRCHRCHVEGRSTTGGPAGERSTDVLAFYPLEMAPWGISILQPERDVFEPARKLRRTFFFFAVGSIGVALLMAVGMGKSIVKPVHELIIATRNIASGDMTRSVGFGGVDEIGQLSSSFEVMRVKLADSLDRLQQYNIELERRVAERTKEIAESQRKVEALLRKVISVQEEERKRIARELHDDTMQSLSAILMKLDICKLTPDHIPGSKVDEVRDIVFSTLKNIRRIIYDLRPSVIDDLGLEAAIRWLLDKHLGERGISCFFSFIGVREARFDPYTEITLFRFIQEVIVNVARHADAENVVVVLKAGREVIEIDIEDDGVGFDSASALKQTEDGRGLGLLGLKERASLLDGKVLICSSRGAGARVSLRIPIKIHGAS